MIRLFGGLSGHPDRFRSGDLIAEYVVLGDPREVPMGELRRSVDAALNREKRAYKLDPGESWSLALRWSYPPTAEGEAQRIECPVWGGHGNTVGHVVLVWPTPEAMEGRA